MNILVFSDNPSLLNDLLGGAHELAVANGGSASAIIIGPESATTKAIEKGADKVFWLGELEDKLMDDFVPTMVNLVNEQKPAALLIGATIRGKSIAARIAAALNTAVIVNAKEINVVDGVFQAKHMVFGGAVLRVEKPLGDILVATVGTGIFTPVSDAMSNGNVETVSFVQPAIKINKLESKPKKSSASNIGAAKYVVGVGRGFAHQEDLALAKDLADVLGGEVGYTRPVTEGNPPFVEGAPYIGVSGIQLKPELYLAVGISGQTQHVVGINESDVIVSINNDPKALMFHYSDYGIVGDLYEVLPKLTQALRSAKK